MLRLHVNFLFLFQTHTFMDLPFLNRKKCTTDISNPSTSTMSFTFQFYILCNNSSIDKTTAIPGKLLKHHPDKNCSNRASKVLLGYFIKNKIELLFFCSWTIE